HDLRHGESLPEEVVSVLDRAPADLRARDFAETQRIAQLIQEHRNAVVDLRLCRRWYRPGRHLGPAPPDDFVPIDGNKFVEHRYARPIVPAGVDRLMSSSRQRPSPAGGDN